MDRDSQWEFEMWLLRRFAENGGDLLIQKKDGSAACCGQSSANGIQRQERALWGPEEMMEKMLPGPGGKWEHGEGFRDFRFALERFGKEVQMSFRVNFHKGPNFSSMCMRLVSFRGREAAVALIEASVLEKCVDSQCAAQESGGAKKRL